MLVIGDDRASGHVRNLRSRDREHLTVAAVDQCYARPVLPDWVFEAQWDRFGFGYVKPPKRETGYQYWVLGFVDD